MDVYVLLYLFLIAAPISTLIHETGHLVGARLLGADQITLSIGNGKNGYTIQLKRIRILIQPSVLLGGTTKSERDRPYTSFDIAFITACGPLFNVLFCILFYGLHNNFPNEYLFLLMFLNGWFAIINVIPFKVRDRESDGYIIVKQLLNKL